MPLHSNKSSNFTRFLRSETLHEKNPCSCFSPKCPLCFLILPQQAHLFETQMKGDSFEDGGQKVPNSSPSLERRSPNRPFPGVSNLIPMTSKGPKDLDDFIYIHLLRSHLTPISKNSLESPTSASVKMAFQRGSPQCRCWAWVVVVPQSPNSQWPQGTFWACLPCGVAARPPHVRLHQIQMNITQVHL